MFHRNDEKQNFLYSQSSRSFVIYLYLGYESEIGSFVAQSSYLKCTYT